MKNKMPRTPFSTPLSGSAKETEIRIRNIMSGPKRRPPVLFLALVFSVCIFCGNLVSCQSDPRVVCLERTNARYLSREEVPEELAFASVDVSFISLKLILPPLAALLKEGGQVVSLVKPQFEAGREKVGKKGVVRDPAVHLEVLERYLDHAGAAGLTVRGLTYSPIRGPEGNIEYLGPVRPGPPL